MTYPHPADPDNTSNLVGASWRDRYKKARKDNRKFGPRSYGIDLDFVLVEKNPPGIVAFQDYKYPSELDYVRFAEVLAYNRLMTVAPVYIVETANPEEGPFSVRRYWGGDSRPNPPVVKLPLVGVFVDWEAFYKDFEEKLRAAFRKRNGQWTIEDLLKHAD